MLPYYVYYSIVRVGWTPRGSTGSMEENMDRDLLNHNGSQVVRDIYQMWYILLHDIHCVAYENDVCSFIYSLSLCIMQMCSKCKQNNAILWCSECEPHYLLCVDCDQNIQWMDPLHDREIWKDGFFQFVPHILPLMFNQ